jgi:hypothetical protein
VAYMCACMCARHVCCCVLGRSLSSTHAETHACNGLHLRVRTRVHALAIPLAVRLLFYLLDATHALMPIRPHADRNHALLARLCHVPNLGAIRRPL